MRKFLIPFLLIIVLSCEKDEVKAPGLFLMQGKFSDKVYTNYHYSNEGKLLEINSYLNDQISTTYYHYNKGILEKSETLLKNNSTVGFYTTRVAEFVFDSDNKVLEYTSKSYGHFGSEEITSYEFFYLNNHLDSIKFQIENDWDKEPAYGYYKVETSEKGNILLTTKYTLLEKEYVTEEICEYKYDNKKNPFHLVGGGPDIMYYYFSPNNVVETPFGKISYEYNSEGYPTRVNNTQLVYSEL